MFGYVKTDRGELRIREYEYYRASYCGLCRAMGKCTGQCSRLLLSYDFAFLANVRMLLCGTKPRFARRRCIAHPLRRRRMMEPDDQLCYCAAASAILAFEKCRDDVADERGLRALGARVKCVLLYRMYAKAKKRVPALAVTVREHLDSLSAKEAEREASVDAVATIFARLLGDVVSYGLQGDAALLAHKIGFAVGRFIYILDALDDVQKDAKRGRFNPFLLVYGAPPDEQERASIRDALIAGLFELESALDLLPDGADPAPREILNNILYLGMPQTMDKVLGGGAHKKESSREQQPI